MVNNEGKAALNRNEKIRNIIFDMDGTIVDTSKVTIRACKEVSMKFGLPPLDSETIVAQIGWPAPEFFYRLYPDFEKDIIKRYGKEAALKEQELMVELGKDILFPDMLELINELSSDKYYLGIASTGTEDHVNTALEAAGIKQNFNIIKCNEAVKTNMVKNIIDEGPKGNWMIVGDRKKDFEAGHANNILTVGAAYGFGTFEELDMFDITIDTPLNLLKILA